MEEYAIKILEQLGITSGVAVILFFIMKVMIEKNSKKLKDYADAVEKKNAEIARLQEQATRERKAARDLELSQIKKDRQDDRDAFTRHITGHVTFEKEILGKIETIYQRLNPIGESVARIEGIIETQLPMPRRRAQNG